MRRRSMKRKKINTKLILNKSTVANLSKETLKNVKGAGTGITCTVCDTFYSCVLYACMVDFTDDNTCTTLPTQTRVDTCPVEFCI